MLFLTYLIYALILGMVPFSVALNSSVYRCIEWKESFRMAFVLAIFIAISGTLGWALGYAVKGLFFDMKLPVALVIMVFIAFRLFMDSRRRNKEIRIIASEHRRLLISFGIVTSINPLLLGISIGMIYPGVPYFAASLAVAIFLLVIVGVRLGKLGWLNFGRTMELAGAVTLFAAAFFIVLQYLKII